MTDSAHPVPQALPQGVPITRTVPVAGPDPDTGAFTLTLCSLSWLVIGQQVEVRIEVPFGSVSRTARTAFDALVDLRLKDLEPKGFHVATQGCRRDVWLLGMTDAFPGVTAEILVLGQEPEDAATVDIFEVEGNADLLGALKPQMNHWSAYMSDLKQRMGR